MAVHNTRNNEKIFPFEMVNTDTRLRNVPLEYFLFSFHLQKKSRKVFLCSLRFSGAKNDTLSAALGFPHIWFQISWKVEFSPIAKNSADSDTVIHCLESGMENWAHTPHATTQVTPAAYTTTEARQGSWVLNPPPLIQTHPGIAHSRRGRPSPLFFPTIGSWRPSFYTFWKNIWAPQNREEHGKIPSGITRCWVQTAYSLQRGASGVSNRQTLQWLLSHS